MSSTLRNGETRDLNLTASDYITLVAVSGTYTATVVRGNSSGTVLGTNVTGGTYGPYTGGAVIRVVTSASSEVDFDIGASPVIVSDTFVTASTNPVTGGIGFATGGVQALDAKSVASGSVLASPGTTVLDFSLGSTIATSTATQSSCTATWNPYGWSDGTGCLEIVPTSDAFSEFRMYFDSSKQFDLWSDDGYAVEWEMPNIEDKAANTQLNFTIGTGATSTATPANTRTTQMFRQPTGTQYFTGKRYDRHRWDFDTTDANCGVWPGYAATVTGAGVTKANTINWCRFEFTRYGGKTIKIRRVVRGGKARPCIVLGTDAAAFYPLNELVNAYMAKLGWKWSINQYFGGGDGVDDLVKSKDVIRAIYASGSDYNINDLIDRNLASAGLTQQQVYDMAAGCIAKANGYGWKRGQNIYIYNNNAYNDVVVAGLQQAGVVAGRAGVVDGRYVFPEGGIVNQMRIPSAAWDQLTTAQMSAQIDRLITYGATQWVYFHNVYSTARVTDDGQAAVGAATPSAYAGTNAAYCTPRGINATTVWWEELKAALDYIKTKEMAGLIDVMSPSQWALAHGLKPTIF